MQMHHKGKGKAYLHARKDEDCNGKSLVYLSAQGLICSLKVERLKGHDCRGFDYILVKG